MSKKSPPKIAFIGAGSTIFMKNIIGDILLSPPLEGTTIALMDIDAHRLSESEMVVQKMMHSVGRRAKVSTHRDLAPTLQGVDFVILAFQIGGYQPCTVTDFSIPKSFGLEQTIGDTIGIGGIMRALRTVPHSWSICEHMQQYCPQAWLLNYVNPMAINTWAVTTKYPNIRYIGLCHSVQNTIQELAYDLGIDEHSIAYRVAGINHLAFFLRLEQRNADGSRTPLSQTSLRL